MHQCASKLATNRGRNLNLDAVKKKQQVQHLVAKTETFNGNSKPRLKESSKDQQAKTEAPGCQNWDLQWQQ